MSVSNTEAIKRMLLAQPAVAYVSSLSVRDEVRRGDLEVLDVADLRIERSLHMVWPKGRSLSPGTRVFADLALRHTAVAGGCNAVLLRRSISANTA